MLARKRLLFDYATPGESIQLPFTPGPRYGGQLRKVLDELFKLREQHARIVVVTRQAERLSELSASGIFSSSQPITSPVSRNRAPYPGSRAMAEGWQLPGSKDELEEHSEQSTGDIRPAKEPRAQLPARVTLCLRVAVCS